MNHSLVEHLHLNIYGITVHIRSTSKEVITLLSKDFSFFKENNETEQVHYTFCVFKEKVPWEKLYNKKVSKHSVNSLSTQDGTLRYNDYYGKALTIYNYTNDTCDLYANDINILHELSYLIILSRTGKKLDTKGMHKIHAFAVSRNDTTIIGMMPSKGGKSTLFLELLKFKDIEILSDDTPLVSKNGTVHPFPLRVGIEEGHPLPDGDQEKTYSIQRTQYGKKILLPMNFFSNEISSACGKVILLDCKRHYSKDTELFKIPRYQMITPLIKNMVIGVGLPIIIEYFLELTFKDFIRLTGISLKRLRAMIRLLFRSQCYRLYLGSSYEANAKKVCELFEKEYDK